MKFKPGEHYLIEFIDHAAGVKKPMIFKATGWCVEDHSEYCLFSSWWLDTDDSEMFNLNLEPFVILKNCIRKKRIIK